MHISSIRFLLCSLAVYLSPAVQQPLQADWSKPITIAAPGFVDRPQVAINKKGEAIVVFAGSEVGFSNLQIEAATLKKGVPSTPHIFQLSNSFNADFPKVAINKHGNAALAWVEVTNIDSGANQLVASSYVNGRWSNPTVLTDTNTTRISTPSSPTIPGVTLDASGNGLAVWLDVNDSTLVKTIRASRLEKRKWKQAETIFNTSDDLNFPVLAGNSKGDVLVAWVDFSTSLLQAAQFKDGVWQVKTFANSNVQTEEQGEGTPLIAVAINESGDGVIAWADKTVAIQAVRLVDGEWRKSKTLSDFSLGEPMSLDVALDDDGEAVVIWNINTTLAQASRLVNGRWQNPVTLIGPVLDGANVTSTLVGIDSDANAAAVFQQVSNSGNNQIEARILNRGKWRPFMLLSDPDLTSALPQIAMNPSGKAVVVWLSGLTSPTTTIQASVGTSLFR
jgi:hypothetical protein